MKKTFMLFLLPMLLLAITGCEESLTDSQIHSDELEIRSNNNSQSQMVKEPFNETVWNECTGEWVDLTGVFKSMVHINVDGNGIPHINSKTGFSNASGVGQTTGLKYRLVGNGADCPGPPCVGFRNVNIRCNPVQCPNGVVIFNGVVRQRLVSQTNADDYVITAFFKLTINANGDVPILISKPDKIECL